MSSENNQSEKEPTELMVAETNSQNLKESPKDAVSQSKRPTSAERKEKRAHTIKRIKEYTKLFLSWNVISMTLAHHPECEIYDEHVFKIGKKLRLCRGCTLSYPPMYAVVIIFVFWIQARMFLVDAGFLIANLWWFTIGFGVIGVLALLLRRYSLFINDIYKFSRGAFSGFLFIVILSQHWGFKIGAGIIFMGGMGLLSIHRGKDMEKTCDECEWKSNFDECPGWRNITQAFNSIQQDTEPSPTTIKPEKSIPQEIPIQDEHSIADSPDEVTN